MQAEVKVAPGAAASHAATEKRGENAASGANLHIALMGRRALHEMPSPRRRFGTQAIIHDFPCLINCWLNTSHQILSTVSSFDEN